MVRNSKLDVNNKPFWEKCKPYNHNKTNTNIKLK